MNACCLNHAGPHLHGCALPSTKTGRDHAGACLLNPPTAPDESDDMTKHCPETHLDPHPSQPIHCPTWCDRLHEDRLWLECCDTAPDAALLAMSPDAALWVTLEAVEDSNGAEPARLALRHGDGDLDRLTIDQVAEYASTLSDAVTRVRHLTRKGRNS